MIAKFEDYREKSNDSLEIEKLEDVTIFTVQDPDNEYYFGRVQIDNEDLPDIINYLSGLLGPDHYHLVDLLFKEIIQNEWIEKVSNNLPIEAMIDTDLYSKMMAMKSDNLEVVLNILGFDGYCENDFRENVHRQWHFTKSSINEVPLAYGPTGPLLLSAEKAQQIRAACRTFLTWILQQPRKQSHPQT